MTPRAETTVTTSTDSGDAIHAPANEHHRHDTLEIPVGQPVPTVHLVVHPDAVRGWNLEIQITHFRFALGRG